MTDTQSTANEIAAMFARERDWLQRQPNMTPWEQGCMTLEEQIDRWLKEYSAGVCEEVVTRRHAAHAVFVGRLWGCWSYHWHQAADRAPRRRIEGPHVAEQIRAGRGWLRGGRLGGDPLRDTVLAVAMPLGDDRAVACFQSEYFDFLRRLAGKQRQRFYQDPDAWWNEFLDHLAGYTQPNPRLARFQGRSGLRNWLGTVLWYFLRRRDKTPAHRTQPLDEDRVDGARPDVEAELGQCLEFFVERVREALGALSKEDRLVLYLLYVDRLKLKEVARIVGKHAGNVGKQRDRALGRLRRALAGRARDRGREELYEECLELRGVAPKDFADALIEALRATCDEETGQ